MLLQGSYDTNLLQKFFSELASNKSNFTLASYMSKFAQLNSNSARIHYVTSDLKKYNMFPKYIKSEKSDQHSRLMREHGNAQFSEGNYRDALFSYTESITFAESDEELALSYANRSACLYKMCRYEDCIVDISRALNLNYPEASRRKLLQRRSAAQNALTDAPPLQTYYEKLPELAASRKHLSIQCASCTVEIGENDEMGRGVFATRDIKIGEVISIEKPFARFLISARLQHCDFCLELCYNPMPCRYCTLLVYCGMTCERRAFDQYHQYECDILMSLESAGVTGIEEVALRTVLQFRLQNEKLDFNEDVIYKSDRYKELHFLSTARGRFPQEKLLYFSIVASYIIYFLTKYTSFFHSAESDIYKNLIFLQLQIARMNAIPIEENVYPIIVDHVNQSFATGVFAFSSLFNHSCAPNVEKIFYGDTLVTRSVNSIRQGEQLFISYGVTYNELEKKERQHFLDNYLFACRCRACEQQWDFVEFFSEYKKPAHEEMNLHESQYFLMKVELMQNNLSQALSSLPHLENCLKQIEDFEPWNNTTEIKNAISKCYKMFGNKRNH